MKMPETTTPPGLTFADFSQWPAPGIYPNIPAEQYHALDAVSATLLKEMADTSPAHARYAQTHPKDETPAMAFGAAAHMYLLERKHFLDTYTVREQCEKITAKGERCTNPGKVRSADAWLCGVHGKDLPEPAHSVSREEFERIREISRAMKANTEVANMFRNDERETELSVVALAGDTLCKARIDLYLPDQRMIVDLKTTPCAAEHAFARTMASFRYHVQAAWYCYLMTLATGEPHETFRFIAVETDPPYGCQVFELPPRAIALGRTEFVECLETVGWCHKNNRWPSYSGVTNDIDLPEWAYRRERM